MQAAHFTTAPPPPHTHIHTRTHTHTVWPSLPLHRILSIALPTPQPPYPPTITAMHIDQRGLAPKQGYMDAVIKVSLIELDQVTSCFSFLSRSLSLFFYLPRISTDQLPVLVDRGHIKLARAHTHTPVQTNRRTHARYNFAHFIVNGCAIGADRLNGRFTIVLSNVICGCLSSSSIRTLPVFSANGGKSRTK